MNTWISDSLTLIQDIASFLISEPVFYIVGALLLLIIVKLFKGLVGGSN